MARLTSIRSRLTTVRPKLASAPVDRAAVDRVRGGRVWRKWYKTARWRALRWSVLVRDHFTCQRCQRIEGDTSKLVADHRTPHRGDAALFWDESNLWTLCASCHSGAKQREERADC
ncbi:HNH endonuclease [Hephaestia caeni]|uniref:Putative HNH nuclease YajD n=1 Tax=Hephaestia caeni TaxID=645617 RepID=A0A397NQM0_9SPHN|nr:HNH endonuclease signature motif containing protein [Hephaestia caeni]RIA37487.1 HNH endonuclease [Hephaestia caeni]